jgi:hypothetical protein
MSKYYTSYSQYLDSQRCCDLRGLGPTGSEGPTGPSAIGQRGETGPTGPSVTGPTGRSCKGDTGPTGPTGANLSTTNSWVLTPGANAVSFTVDLNNTYVLWVRGNIPNGICVWNATVTVTNSNVPVLGNQYSWYYSTGNQLVLTSIPSASQIIGTPGSIINTPLSYPSNDSNTFTFGITNNSGSNATVYYGYTKL